MRRIISSKLQNILKSLRLRGTQQSHIALVYTCIINAQLIGTFQTLFHLFRARAYRRRLKEKGKKPKRKKVSRKEMRAYWKLRKRESRKRLSLSERIQVRMYDCERKKKPAYKSTSRMRTMIYRARKALPKSPSKFANVIDGLVEGATPKKGEALDLVNIYKREGRSDNDIEHIRDNMKILKLNKTKFTNFITASLVKAAVNHKLSYRENARRLGLRWSYMQRIMGRKDFKMATTRSDSISEERKEEVSDFYHHSNIAVQLPDMRRVTKHGATKVMQMSIQRAYDKYKEASPNAMSKSKFASLRPPDVKLQSKNKLRSCLCPDCANVALMGDGLHKAITRIDKHKDCPKCMALLKMLLCADKMSDATLCPKKGNYKPECVKRQCPHCGVEKLSAKINHLLEHNKNLTIDWFKWENVLVNGKKKMNLVTLNASPESCRVLLEEILHNFSYHKFISEWQINTVRNITQNVPPKTVLSIMDFGQNYVCYSQDEPQQMHWDGHAQVTIHPIVTFYQCPRCDDATTRREIVFLTDDLKHDSHSVRQFEKMVVGLLKQDIEFDVLIEADDGAASQYKSCNSFEDISEGPDRLNIQKLKRIFFASHHGKGPSDGVTGVVKSFVSRAVKAGTRIRNAEEMTEFCNNNLSRGQVKEEGSKCNHSLCSFIYISHIERNRNYTAATISGTRQIHMVESVSPGVVEVKNIACSCDSCLLGKGNCINRIYVQPAKMINLQRKSCFCDYKIRPEVQKKSKDRKRVKKMSKSKKKSGKKRKTNKVSQVQHHTSPCGTRNQTNRVLPSARKTRSHNRSEQSMSNNRSKKCLSPSPADDKRKSQTQENGRNQTTPNISPCGTRSQTSDTLLSVRKTRSQSRSEQSMANTRNKKSLSPSPGDKKKSQAQASGRSLKQKTETQGAAQEKSARKRLAQAGPSLKPKKSARKQLFSSVTEINQKVTFKDLKNLPMQQLQHATKELLKELPPNVRAPRVTVLELKKSLDKASLDLLPEDIRPDLYPVQVIGDGNCLARCASIFAFGDENKFLDIRLLIGNEMMTHRQFYIEKYRQYAMYSEHFVAGMNLYDDKNINTLFDMEIKSALTDSAYLGMFHLAAIASVLSRSVTSVYPQYGGFTVRKEYNRTIEPRKCNEILPPVFIMWTNTSGKKIPKNYWSPNHFVPLLPLHEEVNVEEVILPPSCDSDMDILVQNRDIKDLGDVVQSIVLKLQDDYEVQETKPTAVTEPEMNPFVREHSEEQAMKPGPLLEEGGPIGETADIATHWDEDQNER